MKIETQFAMNVLENHRRGSTLLLVLGVLALLSLIGTAVIFITNAEQKESKAFMDRTRAEFVAESGMETAMAKLMNYNPGPLSQMEPLQTVPASGDFPLEDLLACSFGSIDLDNDGLNELAGKVSQTYSEIGDVFKLRVVDCQSRLNINDSDKPLNWDSDPFEDLRWSNQNPNDIPIHLRNPDNKDPDWIYKGDPDYDDSLGLGGKPHPRAPGRLCRIVGELLYVLFGDEGKSMDWTGKREWAEGISKALFKDRRLRFHGRFNSMSDLKSCMVGDGKLNADQFRIFRTHVTLGAWQDSEVIRPTFQWRVSIPPRLNPDDPMSCHPSFVPSDFPPRIDDPTLPFWQDINGAPVRPLIQRPGMPDPGDNVKAMMDPISHDFNGDLEIGADETFVHHHDIYLYSDMQTKYFELDPRSPVDLNRAPKALIRALVAPVSGWYLQEAPEPWRGESNRARAEDWSGVTIIQDAGYWGAPNFPWLLAWRIGELSVESFMPGMVSYDVTDKGYMPDESLYYYYDEVQRSYVDFGTWNPVEVLFSKKSSRFGELRQTRPLTENSSIGNFSIAELLADRIYARIHPDADGDDVPESFRPFQTWEEFEDFIQGLSDLEGGNHLSGDLHDFNEFMADALIANFNPNSRLNDYNPNKRIHLHVDKSQLVNNTTEFCFQPMGQYDIISLGLVTGPEKKIVSSSKIRGLAKVNEVFRASSQAKLLQGYDPAAGRDAKAFFSESLSGENPTAAGTPAYNGHSLQSYPEPEVQLRNHIEHSWYDGYLMLSTWKPRKEEMLVSVGGANDNRFLVNFDGNLNAAFCSGNFEYQKDAGQGVWMPDTWHYSRWQLEGGNLMVLDPTRQIPANHPEDRALTKSLERWKSPLDVQDTPGNLFPDGALCDAGRTMRYESKGNIGSNGNDEAGNPIQGRRGSLQFWVKPNFDVAHSNRIRKLFTAPPRKHEKQPVTWLHEIQFYDGSEPEKTMDYTRDFSLHYFSRGGQRIPNGADGRLEDAVDMGFGPIDAVEGRWLPTRSLCLNGGAHYERLYGLGTTSVNQSWREKDLASGNLLDLPSDPAKIFNLETRQWCNLAFSWDWIGVYAGEGAGTLGGDFTPPQRVWRMAVNGRFIEEDRENAAPVAEEKTYPWLHYVPNGGFGSPGYAMQYGIQEHEDGSSGYVAFGESSSGLWNNFAADATYDDFLSSAIVHDDMALVEEFGYGRYYSGDDALFTSPEYDLFSAEDNVSAAMKLESIAWTAYWPWAPDLNRKANVKRFNDNFDGNNSGNYLPLRGIEKVRDGSGNFSDGFDPDPMIQNGKWTGAWIPISVDVYDPAESKWYYQSRGINKTRKPNFAGGSVDKRWESDPLLFKAKKSRKLRFRVHFNIEEGQTLLTSPVFDDITFIFSRSEAQILLWESNCEE